MQECLDMFICNSTKVLLSNIMFIKQLHHYIPETMKCIARGNSNSSNLVGGSGQKKGNVFHQQEKSWPLFFWDAHDVVFIDCVEKGKNRWSTGATEEGLKVLIHQAPTHTSSVSAHMPNFMNSTLNCCHKHHIYHI